MDTSQKQEAEETPKEKNYWKNIKLKLTQLY